MKYGQPRPPSASHPSYPPSWARDPRSPRQSRARPGPWPHPNPLTHHTPQGNQTGSSRGPAPHPSHPPPWLFPSQVGPAQAYLTTLGLSLDCLGSKKAKSTTNRSHQGQSNPQFNGNLNRPTSCLCTRISPKIHQCFVLVANSQEQAKHNAYNFRTWWRLAC